MAKGHLGELQSVTREAVSGLSSSAPGSPGGAQGLLGHTAGGAFSLTVACLPASLLRLGVLAEPGAPAPALTRPSSRPYSPCAPRAGRVEGKVGKCAAPAGESVNGRPGGSSALAGPRHAGAGSADGRGAWGRRRAPLARCSAWKCLH